MPLLHGKSDQVFRTNVAEMIRAGHPRDQALAASYRQQRSSHAFGGAVAPSFGVPHMQAGGRPLARTAAYGQYGTHQPDIDPQDFWANLRHDAPYEKLTRPGDDSGAGDVDQKRLEITASQTRPDVRRPGLAAGGTIIKAGDNPEGNAGTTVPWSERDRVSRGHQGRGDDFRDDDPGHYGFGGRTRLADGGLGLPSSDVPYFARQEARELYQPEGHINLPGAGRTDTVPLSVAAGSYVVPADVVAGLGQGNGLAGAHLIHEMFHTGPYGIQNERLPRGGHSIPRPPRPATDQYAVGGTVRLDFRKGGRVPGYAAGGAAEGDENPKLQKILAAGGEFIIPPHVPHRLGGGDIDAGHRHLDNFVESVRAGTIKHLSNLPGPKK